MLKGEDCSRCGGNVGTRREGARKVGGMECALLTGPKSRLIVGQMGVDVDIRGRGTVNGRRGGF